jgi:hypothetical protein
MTKPSTDIQQLVREYRNTRSPVQVSVNLAQASHESVTSHWFTPGSAGFATALSIASLVFVIAIFLNVSVHDENQAYPSFSLLSAAGISLDINTDSPDMSDLENMPGLMDISIPDSLKPAESDDTGRQTKITKPYTPGTIT